METVENQLPHLPLEALGSLLLRESRSHSSGRVRLRRDRRQCRRVDSQRGNEATIVGWQDGKMGRSNARPHGYCHRRNRGHRHHERRLTWPALAASYCASRVPTAAAVADFDGTGGNADEWIHSEAATVGCDVLVPGLTDTVIAAIVLTVSANHVADPVVMCQDMAVRTSEVSIRLPVAREY